MKMPVSEFETLKADFLAMTKALQVAHGPLNFSEKRIYWQIYHRVMDDRSYDDSHPFYTGDKPRARVLPFVDRFYNARFYNMGLNDSHIETALRKIVSA